MKWLPKATNSKATSGYDYPFMKISILSWIKFRMAENQRRGHLTSLSIQIEVNRLFFFAQTIQTNSLWSICHLIYSVNIILQWGKAKRSQKTKPKQTQQKSHQFFIFHEIYLLLFLCWFWFHHRKKIVQIPNKDLLFAFSIVMQKLCSLSCTNKKI